MGDSISVPKDVIAQKMGTSVRSVEIYLSKLKAEKPVLYNKLESRGRPEGRPKIVFLYDIEIIPLLNLYQTPKKQEVTEKTITLDKEKKPPVVAPVVLKPDSINDHNGTPIEDSDFWKKSVDWKTVFTILEAGATLEETAGFLRVDQMWLAAQCLARFKVSFTQLKTYCFYAGNVKVKLSLYQSAVGGKEKKANSLIQILMAKDRLGLGTKELETPTNPQDIIFLEGKEYDMNEMNNEELERKAAELEAKILAIKEGKSDQEII